MSVPQCHVCKSLGLSPTTEDLDQGDYCPICFNATCRSHLATVRFRWRETRQTDVALICRTCKNSYQHRYWDTARRDWIS